MTKININLEPDIQFKSSTIRPRKGLDIEETIKLLIQDNLKSVLDIKYSNLEKDKKELEINAKTDKLKVLNRAQIAYIESKDYIRRKYSIVRHDLYSTPSNKAFLEGTIVSKDKVGYLTKKNDSNQTILTLEYNVDKSILYVDLDIVNLVKKHIDLDMEKCKELLFKSIDEVLENNTALIIPSMVPDNIICDLSTVDKEEMDRYLKAINFRDKPIDLLKEVAIEEQYISNDYNKPYSYKVDNNITFLNEAITDKVNYSSQLRKILYNERIKNDSEILAYYKAFKSSNSNIKRTYIDLDLYKGANVYIDLYHYIKIFQNNNSYKSDKGVRIYFDLMTNLLSTSKLSTNGYNNILVLIPVDKGVWNESEGSNIWDYKININPISVIDRMMRLDQILIKREFSSHKFLFTTKDYGYFCVDFNKFEPEDLIKFRNNIRILQTKSEQLDDNVVDSETSATIVANIVNKIETSQKVTINNLTGNPEEVTAEDIEDKVQKSAVSSKVDNEKKKEELVSKIKDITEDPSIQNTDDALESMDNNEDIKRIIMDLAAEEDNNIKLNAARVSRMNKLNDEFMNKKIKNTTVKELLSEDSIKERPLPETKLDLDTINDEWEHLTFVNFESTYNLDRDIVNILNSFSEKSVPVVVREIEVINSSTSEDFIETYIVQCEDINGQRFTLKFDVPKFKGGRFMKLRGNEKVINAQLFLLPVLKTDEDTVQIVSNYNKIFVSRYGSSAGKTYITADRIIKTLNKLSETDQTDIKIIKGDNNKICSKYELPIDYIDLATNFNIIENNEYILYFNQDELRSKYEIDNKKGLPIGYDKKNKIVMYYNSENISLPYSEAVKQIFINNNDFNEIYKKTSISTKYVYSKASILQTDIPVIVIMGYNIGLQESLKRAGIEYELSESKSTVNRENMDYIKFNDGYLNYKLSYTSSLLMNGLKECDTDNYSLSDINDKIMWLDFLDSFGGRIKADGLDNFYDLMIDPITKRICNMYNLPDNYIDILVYSNNLLIDNKYNKHVDLTGNRYRTNEIVAGYVYKAMSKSYSDYRNQMKRNRKGVTMTMKQSSVIDAILTDNTSSDLSTLSPLLEKESANTVSFKGLSGMNSDRAYGLDKRTYDDSMINILALSTGFAANVGINRQATIDMNIESNYGLIKTTDNLDNMSITKTMSITEALTPFGTTHDDPFRSAMTFIQSSKHGMRTRKSMPMLITNGADEALPYITSDTFAFKSKEKGKVTEKTDDYMIVTYANGENDFIDLSERVMKNSDGGFYITLKLDSDYKVGQSFKKTEILAYDKYSYSSDVGATDNLAYCLGPMANVAILNTDEGFEDSSIISEWLADAMTSSIVIKKEISIPKNTIIYDIVKKGQPIQEGETLLLFQNAFDEDDMNLLIKNLSDDEDVISDLARISIKSKITGVVQDIKIYRTVEKEELSESLLKLVNDQDKEIKAVKNTLKKYKIDDSEEYNADKLDPIGKLKNTRDGVMIEFYLKYEDKMSIGDKIVYYSAMKGVNKDIFPLGEEPYIATDPKEKIHAFLAIGSANGRMVTSPNKVMGISKIMVHLDRQAKQLMGLPIKYLDEL